MYVSGRAFRNFAQAALIKHKGELKCSESGQPLKSQSPGGNNKVGVYNEEYSEEEDLANVKNKEWNSELLTDSQPSNSIRMKIIELHSLSFTILLSSFLIARRVIMIP